MKKIVCCLMGLLLPVFSYADALREGFDAMTQGKYEQAIEKLQTCADNPRCIAMMGSAYYQLKKYPEAKKYYEQAAQAGRPDAQMNLATMYLDAKGVEKNADMAVRYLRMAAENNLAQAQYKLATLYDDGAEIPKNYKEAVRWYRMASDKGYAPAQNNLASMYALGLELPQSYPMAMELYIKSAVQGHARALSNIGVMLYKGEYLQKNVELASALFGLAAASTRDAAEKKQWLDYMHVANEELTEEQSQRSAETFMTLAQDLKLLPNYLPKK